MHGSHNEGDSHGMLWHRDGILKVSHIEARELGLCSTESAVRWMWAAFKGGNFGHLSSFGTSEIFRKGLSCEL